MNHQTGRLIDYEYIGILVHDIERNGFGLDAPFISDTQVVSPVFSVGPNPFVVSFKNAFDMESDSFGDFFDGGVVELSSDGGLTWRDVTMFGANPGYTATLTLGGGNLRVTREGPLTVALRYEEIMEGDGEKKILVVVDLLFPQTAR